MVSQAINRWFRKLFAWWPWKRSPETGETRVASTLNKGVTQESTLRTTVEGSLELPGITSVAVEHVEHESLPDPSRTTPEERPERVTPSLPGREEPPSVATRESRASSKKADAVPTDQQKLEFLQYLVQRGIVNEGFSQDQEPDQYKP